jgi:hypothetical protein
MKNKILTWIICVLVVLYATILRWKGVKDADDQALAVLKEAYEGGV